MIEDTISKNTPSGILQPDAMTPVFNKAVFMSSGSVIALYVETILQTYVTVSYSDSIGSSPEAIVSLCSIVIAFLSTSIASYIMASSSVLFDNDTSNNDENIKTKMVFKFLHIFQFGLLWRIFKMISSFTGSDVKLLTNLRLVHVTIQSLPYAIIYSSTFLIRGQISAIQSLSLVISIISSASAITCYNLRLKMCVDGMEEEETGSLKHSGKFKSICAVIATFFGTLLVLFSRGASITLMGAQVHWWVLLPLSLHFLVIFLVFILFSSRNSKVTPKAIMIWKHSLYCLGMSILNTFDLVYDNISHVMCKYVAFYSLLLVENIIFISFWLLNYDFDYVSKLVTVLGILTAFIVGLVVKFTGCTFSQWDTKNSRNEEESSQGTTTAGLPSVTTTVASATLNLGNKQPAADKDDDLISIVQASLAQRSHRTGQQPSDDNNTMFQHSSSTNQLLQLNVTSTPTTTPRGTKSPRRTNGVPSNRSKIKSKPSIKSQENDQRQWTASIKPPCSVHDEENYNSSNRPSKDKSSTSTNLRQSKASQFAGPSNSSSNTVDQNDSFQHSSILSVSDPETLLSDMMYDKLGGEQPCCHMPDESLQQNIIKNAKQMKDVGRKRRDLLKSQGSHEVNHPERIHTIHNLNHHPFHPQYNSSTLGKNRPSTFINTTTASKSFVENRKYDGLNLKLNENQYRDFSNQNNESSDNAVSSAKTYPRNSKFDREMNNILSSITATGGENETPHPLNSSTQPYRYSDSEAVIKTNNKSGRLHSSNNKDRRIYKNIITYTEPEDINFNNTLTSNTNTNTSTRHNNDNKDSKPDHRAKKISSSSHKPSTTPKDKIHRLDYGRNSKGAASAPRTVSSNAAVQLCESGSSSFTTTVTHGNVTRSASSSSTTTMTTEDCWHEDRGHSSDAKSDRLSQFLMQSDTDRISPSENILRWLSTTEASNMENG